MMYRAGITGLRTSISIWLSRHQGHLRELLWIALGQASGLLASLATLKLFTTVFAPDSYAQLNLTVVALTLPSWLFFAPLTQATLRWYAPQRERAALPELVYTTTFAYGAMTVTAITLLLAAMLVGVFGHLGLSWLAFILFLTLVVVEAWMNLGLTIGSAARQRTMVAMGTAATAWARLAMSIAGIAVFGASLEVVLAAYAIGSLTTMRFAIGPLMKELRTKVHRTVNWSMLRNMLAYGAPFSLWAVFGWAQQYLDRYIVDLILGATVAGTYIAAVQVVSLPFNLCGNLLAQFITPIVYERVGDGNDPMRMHQATRYLCALLIAFAIGGFFVVLLFGLAGQELMRVLTHGTYAIPSTLLVAIALGSLLTVIAQQLTLLLLATKRAGALIYAKVLPGTFSVPILVCLVLAFDLIGASIAYLCTGAVFLAVVIWLVRATRLTRMNPT